MRALASQDELTRRNWAASFGVSNRSEPVPALAARPSLIGLAPAGSASSIFRGMVSSRLRAHSARHLGASRTELPMGKNTLGGLARKFLAGAAPGLIPTGATRLNGLAPAVFEAVKRYIKSRSAGLLEFALLCARVTGRGLHLFQQVSITIALRRVLRKWPYVNTELAQVRRAKFRPARFQAYG
jgi:hypothetical protein